MTVKMKPGGYSRSELQSALLYPNQTSPELQRAVKVVAEKWKLKTRNVGSVQQGPRDPEGESDMPRIVSGGGINSRQVVQSNKGRKVEPVANRANVAGVAQLGAATQFRKDPIMSGKGYEP